MGALRSFGRPKSSHGNLAPEISVANTYSALAFSRFRARSCSLSVTAVTDSSVYYLASARIGRGLG